MLESILVHTNEKIAEDFQASTSLPRVTLSVAGVGSSSVAWQSGIIIHRYIIELQEAKRSMVEAEFIKVQTLFM